MKRILLGILLVVAALPALAQSADKVEKRLETEAAKLKAWAQDPLFVAAVIAQNNQHLTMAEINKRDEAWMAGKAENLVKEMNTGACADHLRQLTATSPLYSETFVMDNQGALVCENMKTSDYWQGDEAKWQRSFAEGKGAVFIDRPKFDDSSKEHLAQISLPIMKDGKAIGAITIGIDVDKIK
jgi:ABC-type phosphate transport system ATPase subunit